MTMYQINEWKNESDGITVMNEWINEHINTYLALGLLLFIQTLVLYPIHEYFLKKKKTSKTLPTITLK